MKLQPLEFEKPIIELEEKLADLKRHSRANDINFDAEVRRMEGKIAETKQTIYENLTAWQRVQIARHNARPFTLDYLQLSFTNFVEIHGDRLFAEDRAMPGGFATVAGRKCVVIGHQKGRELKENIKRNFGCANPEGYRKALRLMRLAEKFGLPFVSLIDTPGAYPGLGAEERHISEAIAVNLREMMSSAPRPSPSSSAKAAAAARSASPSPTACSCWKTPITPSSPPRAAPRFCGSTANTRPKPPPR